MSHGTDANGRPYRIPDSGGAFSPAADYDIVGEWRFLEAPTIGVSLDPVATVSQIAAPTFQAAGTGAIVRTIQDKLRESVSVKDFGAIGDGVVNDAVAFQAAHDALPAAGGEILAPAGAYAIASALLWTKPVRLVGAGQGLTTITASGQGYTLITSTNTLLVAHLQFTRTPFAANTQFSALRIDNIVVAGPVQCLIDDVTITGFDIGVYVNGDTLKIDRFSVTNARVVVNTARTGNGVQAALTFHNVVSALVDNCVLIQVGTDPSNLVYTIGAQRVTVTNCYLERAICCKVVSSNRVIQTVTFANNYVKNSSSAGFLAIADVYTIRNVAIRDNTFEASFAPDAAAGEVFFGTSGTPTIAYDLLTIEGNVFNTPQGRCVMFGIGVGSTLRHAALRGNTYFGWSAGSSGTFSAVDTGSSGTNKVLSADQEVAIGNSTGRSYQFGANFALVQLGRISETGTTAPTQISPTTVQLSYDSAVTKRPVVAYVSQPILGVGTSADTAEKTLATQTLDANVLETAGGWLEVHAFGVCAANANVKTIKLKVDAVVIATNAITTAPNGVFWRAQARIYRTGSSFSSRWTQLWLGAVPEAVSASPSAALSWGSGTVVLSVTGQNGSAVANDIVCYGFGIDVGGYI